MAFKITQDGVDITDKVNVQLAIDAAAPPVDPGPPVFALDGWGNAPPNGIISGTVEFIVTGYFENVELVPAGKYDPKYGTVTIAPDKRSAKIVLNTADLIQDGTYNLVVKAFDKPAGQPAQEKTTEPRNWTVDFGDDQQQPPPPEQPPSILRLGTGPAFDALNGGVDDLPALIPIGDAPKGYRRFVFDDFSNGLVLDQIDKGLRGYWKNLYTWGDSVRSLAGNGEVQYYTWQGDRGLTWNPFTILHLADGKTALRISCKAATPEEKAKVSFGMRYLSGLIANWSKGNQLYGYVSAKLRMSGVKGEWPAFWMQNGDGPGNLVDQWPPEKDILERPNGLDLSLQLKNVPASDRYFCNTHYKDASGVHKSSGGWRDAGASMIDEGFVEFSWLWGKNACGDYCNGRRIAAMANPGLHLPMHVIFNLAMGGGWAGDVDDSKLPAYLDVMDVQQYLIGD